jgi:hypothetical protein
MQRRTLVALGIYATAAAVALEACGSSEQPPSSDADASTRDDGSGNDVATAADGPAPARDATASLEDASAGDGTSSPIEGGDAPLGADASDANDDTSDANRSSEGDASGDSDAATAPPPAPPPWLLLVNASPDFGAMYLCLSTQLITPNVLPSALPLFPQNMGGALYYRAAPPYDAVDLTTFDISLYGVSPQVAATASGTLSGGGAGCADLVTSSQASLLGTILAGTLAHEASYLVAIVGCVSHDDAGSVCGARDDAGSGNLALQISRVDNTTAAPEGGIGVQFAQASTAWEAVALAYSGSYGGTIGEIYDAGPIQLVGTTSFAAGPVPNIAAATTELVDPHAVFMTVALLADGGQSGLATGWSVPEIQAFSYGIDDEGLLISPPGGFLTNGNWTFVLVGDPSQAAFVDGGLNPGFAHVISLPNQP